MNQAILAWSFYLNVLLRIFFVSGVFENFDVHFWTLLKAKKARSWSSFWQEFKRFHFISLIWIDKLLLCWINQNTSHCYTLTYMYIVYILFYLKYAKCYTKVKVHQIIIKYLCYLFFSHFKRTMSIKVLFHLRFLHFSNFCIWILKQYTAEFKKEKYLLF